MAGPAELLIVVGAFGLVGVYLYIASRFIGEAEKADSEAIHHHTPSS